MMTADAQNMDLAQKKLIGRVPPHNVDAERAVLAGMLIYHDKVQEIVQDLEEGDYYLPAHQYIYRMMLSLYTKGVPIELPSLAAELKAHKLLDKIGGSEYLVTLSKSEMYAVHAEYYKHIILQNSAQRKLLNVCADIIANAYDTTDVDAYLAQAEQSVFEVTQRKAKYDVLSSGEILEDVLGKLASLRSSREAVTGVSTGYGYLDTLTSGLQPTDLIIIAARPSMGKTAFALCLAANAAIGEGKKVGIFSLEMGREQLMHRLLSSQAKVDMAKLRQPSLLTDTEFKDLCQAADVIRKADLYIDDTPALSTSDLRSRLRRLESQGKKLDMIIIDYLQLMRAGRRIDSREQEIADISRSLKAIAKEIGIPVVALAQLNRKVEDRVDKRPQLADLRESGAIEQDADVIMFIYREDVYLKKAQDRPPVGNAEIIIGKQRNGPLGTVRLAYVSRYTSFEEQIVGAETSAA